MDLDKKAGGLYTAKRSSDLEVSAEVAEAWASLRADSDPDGTSWITLTVDQTRRVNLAGKGSGDAGELIAALNDDDVFFGAVRVSSPATKFLHFYFVGANVGGMKKGKSSLLKNGVFNALDGAHGSFEVPGGLDGALAEFYRSISSLAGGATSLIRC